MGATHRFPCQQRLDCQNLLGSQPTPFARDCDIYPPFLVQIATYFCPANHHHDTTQETVISLRSEIEILHLKEKEENEIEKTRGETEGIFVIYALSSCYCTTLMENTNI